MRAVIYARYSARRAARGLDRGPGRGLPPLCRAAGLAAGPDLRGSSALGCQCRPPGLSGAAGRCRARPVRRRGGRGAGPDRPQARRRRRPARSAGVPPHRPACREHGRRHHHACRPARHHGPALPVGPQGQDAARTARPGAAGQGRRWSGLRLPCGRGRDRLAPDRRGRGGGCAPDLQAVRRWREPTRHRPRAQCGERAGAGRAAVAGHDHPRPGRARHRHPEQRALRRPAGLEPLLATSRTRAPAVGWRGRTRPSSGSGSRSPSCGSSTRSSGRR